MVVRSIDEFSPDKTYVSEKGTRIYKTSAELVLGDLIRIPLHNDNGNLQLTGILPVSIAGMALEFFTRSKLEDGITLYYDDPDQRIMSRAIKLYK